jgi:hypothetical protein
MDSEYYANGFTYGVPMDSELYWCIAKVFELRVCANGFTRGLPMDSENHANGFTHGVPMDSALY